MIRTMGMGLLVWAALHCGAVAEEAPVTLYYWGNELDLQAGEMLRDFERLHGGRIRVVAGQSASINKTDDPQRLLCAVAGGDPPDVVFFDRFAVGAWAAKDAFLCLQPFIDRDQRERPDDPFTLYADQFYEACWAEGNYDGRLYALPFDTDVRCLYYNKDIFDKYSDKLIAAGCVDPDDPSRVGPPRTWDQLEEAIKIITAWDASGKPLQLGFTPHSPYSNSWLYIYGWLNGGKFMSEDGRTCTLNSPEIVEALAFMTRLYDLMGGTEAVTAFEAGATGAEVDPFLAGKVAMKIDGDGYLQRISDLRRDLRFGVALAPSSEGNPQLGWSGGWSYVIPKGCKHPEEAWELIRYLGSARAYKIRMDARRQMVLGAGNTFIPNMSARRDITEWAMDHYVYSDPSIDEKFKEGMRVFVEEAMPTAKYRPVTPVGQILWNKQVWAMQSGIYKRFSPDPHENAKIALDSATADVQKELDRIYKPEPYPVLSWTPVLVTYILLVVVGFILVYRHFNRRMEARGYFRREFYAGYLFALPWFIGFIVFSGGPILFSLFMSFCHYDVFSPPKFVGLQNYVEMFTQEKLFYKSLWNTVYMALAVPLSMAVGLGIALLLNYEVKGMAVYRTFFYLPAIMPAVASSILWIWIFNPQQGLINTFLESIGIPGPGWLQNQYWSKPALIIMTLWGAGASMIVWLAGLKGIPEHLYEAAELDGAGRFRQFWSVTLPMLSPYILFNLIMGLIATFQIFTQAFIMTQGGPVDSTLFYVYELFNRAFRYMQMGYASAMAWVLFGIILVLTVIQLRLSKRWVHYESEG